MKDRPSSTAFFVAQGLYLVSATPELSHLVPTAAAELTASMLSRHSRGTASLVGLCRKAAFRRVAYGLQAAITPGTFVHYAVRKAFIESRVRQALQEGFEQVVILGAGVDTLALRLHLEFSHTGFYELDHPATQAAKLAALPDNRGGGNSLHFVSVDLANSTVAAALATQPDFLPERPTVFVAEGLLMYLTESAVTKLLTELGAGASRRIVFTAMGLNSDGNPGFTRGGRLVRWWLARTHEPYLWGAEPTTMRDFLNRCELRLSDHADAARMRREVLTPKLAHVASADGEHVYVANGLSRLA